MSNLEMSRAQRLDQKVVEMVPELSRAFAAKLIEQGKVSVNGMATMKAGHKLQASDRVDVDYDIAELEKIPDIDLPVLYEDDDCVVINKPAGVLTHSKGTFNPEATVATWLRMRRLTARSKEQGASSKKITTSTAPSTMLEDGPLANNRMGIVHRLDRATSGVMICAKTPEALSWLQKQFSQRKVKKTYMAIVAGKLEPEHAVIDMPIERNPKAPATFRVGANGKAATTEYVVEKTSAHYTLVKLRPTTGRTHQLRVHLKQLGHPIMGDTLYDGEPAERLFLHALSLEITLPNRERKVFTTPLPKKFEQKLKADRG